MCSSADSWAATHVILILPTRPTLSLHGGVEKCFVILISFTPPKKSFPKHKPGGSMGWVGIRIPFLQGTRLLTLVNMPKLEEKNIYPVTTSMKPLQYIYIYEGKCTYIKEQGSLYGHACEALASPGTSRDFSRQPNLPALGTLPGLEKCWDPKTWWDNRLRVMNNATIFQFSKILSTPMQDQPIQQLRLRASKLHICKGIWTIGFHNLQRTSRP